MTDAWAVITHNVVAVRSAPESGSEQISQLIMADEVRVLELHSQYARIAASDAYEGWILKGQMRPCEEFDLFVRREVAGFGLLRKIKTPFADFVNSKGELMTRLVFGSRVRVHDDPISGPDLVAAILPGGENGFLKAETMHANEALCADRSKMCSIARQFLGTPYLWGGTTPFGFDCSGLVQRVYSAAGATLPRDAYLQAKSPLGNYLPESSALEPGDLVFFCGERDSRQRGITHVGLMINSWQMIHAYGKTGVTLQALADAEIRSAYSYRGAWRLK